ncbi:MAG: 30S ribosomal protein S8 [Candidatus Paracaedibacteraceae bacterium]|nr:30S ribosomal protein S8 [Candidatus Paracaedibacteraceae bacterium]
MTMTDPISDMLTRIRNAHRANKQSVIVPASKEKEAILAVLQSEGYIRGFARENVRAGIDMINVELKYYEGNPVITTIERKSKPGRRVYVAISDIKPIANGLGINILSTSRGIMSDVQARQINVGGELICSVF